MSKPTIIIDTRENRPYVFDPSRAHTEKRKLDAGDYSLLGFESRIAVERKSLPDFVSTVLRSRGRFSRELQRLAKMEAACIVVEAGVDTVLNHRYRSDAHPNAIIGMAIGIEQDYQVPVHFCADRQCALAFTQAYLLRFFQKEKSRS